MSDDEHYRRVAIHADITDEDVPGDIETTKEELDTVIEITFLRPDEQYAVYERHLERGVLHLQHEWPMDEYQDALDHAIALARETGHPLLSRIYAYTFTTDPDELGEDRIPVPWDDKSSGEDG